MRSYCKKGEAKGLDFNKCYLHDKEYMVMLLSYCHPMGVLNRYTFCLERAEREK